MADRDEVVILRGRHAQEFLTGVDDAEDDEDAESGEESESEESESDDDEFEDEDGQVWTRKAAAPTKKAAKRARPVKKATKKAEPAKRRGYFDKR